MLVWLKDFFGQFIWRTLLALNEIIFLGSSLDCNFVDFILGLLYLCILVTIFQKLIHLFRRAYRQLRDRALQKHSASNEKDREGS